MSEDLFGLHALSPLGKIIAFYDAIIAELERVVGHPDIGHAEFNKGLKATTF